MGGLPAATALQRLGRTVEREHGVLVVPLGDSQVDAVDNGRLRRTAGHGAGPEERLVGGRGQHHVGGPGEQRAKVVSDGNGSAATSLRLGHRVDDVKRLAAVADAEDDVPTCQHRRGGKGQVPIDRGRGGQADAAELVLEVERHQAGGTDAVDLDAARPGQHVHHALEADEVQLVHRVGGGAAVGSTDLGHDVGQRVVRRDVGTDDARDRLLCGGPSHLRGQGQPQLRIARETSALAHAHDGGYRGRRAGGEVADTEEDDVAGLGQDAVRHSTLGRR